MTSPTAMQTYTSPAADLVRKTAQITGIAHSRLYGTSKTRRTVRARWAIWMVMRRQGLSFQEIGDIFGRHYSSIIKAMRPSASLLARDSWFKSLVNHLSHDS